MHRPQMYSPVRRREGVYQTIRKRGTAIRYAVHVIYQPICDAYTFNAVLRPQPHAQIIECTTPRGHWCLRRFCLLCGLAGGSVCLVHSRWRHACHHSQQLRQAWIGRISIESLLEQFSRHRQSSLLAGFHQ